jgi:hypothetical protein
MSAEQYGARLLGQVKTEPLSEVSFARKAQREEFMILDFLEAANEGS